MKGYLFVTSLLALVVVLYAGCAHRGCCEGDDNKCITKGPRLRPSNKTTCFCDERCIVLGDCCDDYHEACIAEDCVVGEWQAWGECSEACKWGHKTRRREILQNKRFAGRDCDVTVQKTYCFGDKCKGRRQPEQEVSETGNVIPAEYGSWRVNKLYSPYHDIRKNLFERNNQEKKNQNPSYCATFEITDTRKACNNAFAKSWVTSFNVGQRVCVECQASAMKRRLGNRCRGHGAYLLDTKWNAVTVPGCHGKWKMVTQHEKCECDARDDHSFILI